MADDVQVRFGASIAGLLAGVEEAKAAIASVAAPVNALKAGFAELSEVAAATFAIHEVARFAEDMGKLGEEARNTAFVLGLTVHQVGELSGIATLAGGNFDTMQRTLERLARSVQQTLVDANSRAATSFKNLGISVAEVTAHANDLPGLLELIIQRVSELDPGLQRAGVLHDLLGRGMDRLVPLMAQGAEGYDELKQRAQGYADALERSEAAMLRTAEAGNALKLDLKTLAVDGFGFLEGPITAAIQLLDWYVNAMGRAIQAARAFPEAMERIADRIRGSLGMAMLVPAATAALPPPLGTRAVGTAKPGGGKAGGKAGAEDNSAEEEQATKEIDWLTAARDASKIMRMEQIRHLQSLATQHQITIEQMIAGQREQVEIMQTADTNYFEQKRRYYDKDSVEYNRMLAQQKVAKYKFDAEMQALGDRAAEEAARQAEKSRKAWAEPFKKGFDQIGSSIESALTGLADRSKTLAQTWVALEKSATGAGIGLIGSIASKGAASLLGATGGIGLGEFLGNKALSGLGLGDIAKDAAITANTTAVLANTAALGVAAGASAASGAGSAVGAAGSAGGIVGGLASAFSWLGFARGGIVPSAAGGWALPNFAGGVPAMLHGGEMVLPQHLSQGLQEMIGQGGGGDTHVHPTVVINGPADAAQIARMFRDNHGHIADALRSSLRSNILTPRTI